MISPKANEMPSRSAPETAGTDLPARTSVATTDPGPTSTRSAVPSVSATARWDSECSCMRPLLRTDQHSTMSKAIWEFGEGTPLPSLVSSATEQSLFILSPGLIAFDNVEYSSTSLLCEERARRRDGRCGGRFSQPGHCPR